MDDYNYVNQLEEKTIHSYMQEHGIRQYSTDQYGNIVGPPGLAKLLKETTGIQRDEISAKIQGLYDDVDAEYSETILEMVGFNEFSQFLDKDGLFFLKNPKIWELTLKNKLDKNTVELIFNKI